MKNTYRYKEIKILTSLLLFTTLLFNVGCDDKGKGWDDPRYAENFEISIYHKNPKTGEDYTEEELAELTYDPTRKESYSVGQPVELAMVLSKIPEAVHIQSGNDLSIIETLTDVSPQGDKFITPNFVTSLEDLGLIEDGMVMTLKWNVVYQDGSIGSLYFDVKRIKYVDPNEQTDFFVYLKKSSGESMGLITDDKVTSREKDAEYGTIVEFDGVQDKVEVVDVSDLAFRATEDFSIGLWVNTTSTTSDPAMISDKDWGSGGNPGFIMAFVGESWKLNAGDGANRIDIDGGVINDGNWHFLTATFDRDGSATIYQDGQSVGSANMSALTDMGSGLPIRLAQDGTGAYGIPFEGKIGNTFIFDYVLSPEEVESISTPYTGAQWRMESGLNKNITVTNSGATVSGEKGYTFDFNGSTKAAWANPSELDFRHAGDFSVAVWVNTTATNSDPSMIGDKDWGSGGNKGFIFAFVGAQWKVNAGDGEGNRIDIDGGLINDGEWHLIGVTFDRDGKATLYQDGKKVADTDMSALGDMNSGYPIHLAEDGTGSYGPFTGKLANSMIFDYVLTEDQMAALAEE